MNSDQYDQMTSKPTSFRRAELERILLVASHSLPDDAQALHAILESAPIPKPDLHKGQRESDWFEVSMPNGAIRKIGDALLDAEAAAVAPGDAPSAEARRIAGLLDRWSRQLLQEE
jgi:hypothetical protein